MYKFLIAIFCLVIAPHFLFSQTEISDSLKVKKPKKESIFDVFSKQEILEASITTDLTKLEDPKNSTQYWDGLFSYETENGVDSTMNIELKLRGRFRLMRCDFPPLKIKFKKKNLKKGGVRKKYNKMKLVTHCLDDKIVAKELIFRECLTYRLFNVINENSFRVQLVNMKYYSPNKKRPQAKGLGILVEDAKQVADRIGGKKTKSPLMGKQPVNTEQENLTALFQYMIANADWNSNKTYKNVAMIESDEEEEFYTVPYDFDFSGFVSAPYAMFTKEHGQKSLRDRVFLGRAKTVEELLPAINIYKEKKEALLQEIANFDLLSRSSRKELKKFIEEFYSIIEDGDNLEGMLFKR